MADLGKEDMGWWGGIIVNRRSISLVSWGIWRSGFGMWGRNL